MRLITTLAGVLVCALPFFVQAQSLPAEPDAYASAVEKLLSSSGNAQARSNGQLFQAAWQGGAFSASQQAEVISLGKLMQDKRFKPDAQLSSYYGTLAVLAQQQSPLLDDYLQTTREVVMREGTRQITDYLTTLRQFVQEQKLYSSNFFKLYAIGGSFSLAYEMPEAPAASESSGWDQEAQEEKEEEYFSDWDTPASEDDSWGNDWSSWDEAEASENAEPAKEEVPVYLAPLMPEVSGAVLRFDKVSLSFVSNADSVILQNTGGSFMPTSNIWVGNGGKFDWTLAGLSPDSVYVILKEYTFQTNKPELLAETAELSYPSKLEAPVVGVFEYKTSRYKSPEEAQYPRFKSYESNIKVRGLGGNDLIYKGGFSLSGQKIYSSSVNSGIATITVLNEEKAPRLRLKSKRFTLGGTQIQADRAAMVIYHQQDSIFHPAIQANYNPENKQLTVLKDEGGFKSTPFLSSFLQMDMSADMLQWDLLTDSLNLTILSGKGQVPALFESQEYYNPRRFDELKGIYDFHPLIMAVGYARKRGSGKFYVEDMAKALGQNPKVVRGAIIDLMRKGFVDYDAATDFMQINRKGYHYVLSRDQRKDYDDLLIASMEPSLPNATFYLGKQQLKIRGIEQFYISRSKDVFIRPQNEEITLLRNRDFMFDGQIHAGSFVFIGKQMLFDYDSFTVELPVIDSIKFDVDQLTEKKQLKRVRLDNQLAETSGKLFVDLPNNKSSRRHFPHYPIFQASSSSNVFYDRPEVAQGAYSKAVSVLIPPFEIDSLSSSDPASITFPGTFFSNGILPEMAVTLKVQEDNSLGFTKMLPAEGLALYGGPALLYDTLRMDKEGLHTSGHLDFQTSVFYSDNFRLFEDSVLSDGYKMEMQQGLLAGAEYPQAGVGSFAMEWYPKADSMRVQNRQEEFKLYNDQVSLKGTLLLSQKGLLGQGELSMQGAQAQSDKFDFNQTDFTSNNALFNIKPDNTQKAILAAKDVYVNYLLSQGRVEISPEVEGVAALEFPYAQYRTSIPKAIWDLKSKTVTMSKPEEFDLTKSYFYASRPELDSLVFNAEGAVYDIDALSLKVSGIPFIKVADAKIMPQDGKVLISEGARMQKLQNASLLIDTLNGYHQLHQGNIDIVSRNKFEGSATYRLVNAVGDTFNIELNRFELLASEGSRRTAGQLRTVSSGMIKHENPIIISPGMLYRGKVTMFADKPALQLDGFVKLDLKNVPKYDTWIRYNSTGDQKEIAFDFEKSRTEQDKPLTAGVFLDIRTNDLYPAFITNKRNAGDMMLFEPAGMLTYAAQNNEYRIEETNKKLGKSYVGRIFAYNENSGEVRFEGPIQLVDPAKSPLEVKAAGLGKGSFQSSEFDISIMLTFDFRLPVAAEEAMGADLADVAQRMGIKQAHADRQGLLFKAAEIIGEQAARSWEESNLTNYVPLVESSSALERSLVLSNVHLKWSEEHKAWYSNGKIGVSNVGSTDVNAKLDGFVEIRKAEEMGDAMADVMNIFLQAAPGVWYYFSYKDGRLDTFSSLEAYNQEIAARTRISKAKPGEYVFVDSDIAETLKFVNNFRLKYYGIDTPYELSAPEATEADPNDPFGTGTQTQQPADSTAEDDDDGF